MSAGTTPPAGAALVAYPQFAGKRIALVEHMLHYPYSLGVQQAQANGLHLTLLLADEDWYTHGQPWETNPLACVDDVIHVDTSDVEAVVQAVTDEAGRPRFDGITSFSDYHTVIAAQVAARLGLPGPTPEAVARCNEKDRLRVAIGDAWYNIPHILATSASDLDRAQADLGFPMIAKPPAEAISYGVRRVDNPGQLKRAYEELACYRHSLRGQDRPGHVLLEAYVEGVEVSVESMTIDGKTHIFGVTSKDLFGDPAYIECGHTFPVALPQESRDELYALVRSTLQAAGYDRGPCHTEARHTADGWRLIEANPRTPSSCMTMLVADVTGRSPILDAWSLAIGVRPAVEDIQEIGGAAVRMLYPAVSGVLDRIDGIEEAAGVNGVEVLLHVHPGESLMTRTDNSSCIGFTYCVADSIEEAKTRADRAAGQLTFVTTDGQSAGVITRDRC